MYFIPSIQQKTAFKPLTIGQLRNIISYNNKYPSLHTGLSYKITKTIIDNSLENINLTDFDKHIIILQIFYNEIKQKPKNITTPHPKEKQLSKDSYNISLKSPFIIEEKKHLEHLIKTNDFTDKDNILLTEIGKYINTLTINNVNIDWNISVLDKNNILNKFPISILSECITYVDDIKQQIKQIYKQEHFSLALLIP
jgi:hypothetical protein